MQPLEWNSSNPQIWTDTLHVQNRYTVGVAGEKFFRAIKNDARITGTLCKTCDRIDVPGAMFCERCLNQLDKWIDTGNEGKVLTYTLLYIEMDGSQKPEPEIIAFIKICDGGIVHRILGVQPDQVKIGMNVAAKFKPASKRTGSILDILGFQPV